MKNHEVRQYKGCVIHIEYYRKTPTSKNSKIIFCYDQNKNRLNFGRSVSFLYEAKAVIDIHNQEVA